MKRMEWNRGEEQTFSLYCTVQGNEKNRIKEKSQDFCVTLYKESKCKEYIDIYRREWIKGEVL